MMWFDKQNPDVIFGDIRELSMQMSDGYHLNVCPDVKLDFRNLPYEDNAFKLVVFDPPHVDNISPKSIIGQKYGSLLPTWEQDIKQGVNECMRVLAPQGVLIFKWNEVKIPVGKILKIIDHKPLFGHTSGKHGRTIWMAFMKQ